MKFNKWIVLLVIALNAIYASAALLAFIKVGSEAVILTGAWFAFTTGELWMLASIKKKETRKDDENAN